MSRWLRRRYVRPGTNPHDCDPSQRGRQRWSSQHIDDFHRDVLANAGMKLVFRTNFPASKAVANFLIPKFLPVYPPFNVAHPRITTSARSVKILVPHPVQHQQVRKQLPRINQRSPFDVPPSDAPVTRLGRSDGLTVIDFTQLFRRS